MKAYRDVFGNPLSKAHITAAVRLIVQEKKATTSLLTRRLGFGYGKASRVMELLEDASVVSLMHDSRRTILLKNESAAINAALRQLKKGKVSA